MKTINYALSNPKCLDEGWTLRPPSPLENGADGTEVFEPQPVAPPWAKGRAKVIFVHEQIVDWFSDYVTFLVVMKCTETNNYTAGSSAINLHTIHTF